MRSRSCVDFAGVPVAMTSADEGWRALAERRYDLFHTDRPARFSIHYRVLDPTPGPGVMDLPELHPIASAPEQFETNDRSVIARVDLDQRHAQIDGPRASAPVDELMRHLLPFLLEDGIVVHGGVLGDGERAWVFAGPSGAGKSTLASMFPDHALCDELAAIRPDGDGFVARSLPYWTARPGGARLIGIFLLRHGEEHLRRRLSPARALQSLTRQVSWPAISRRAIRRCFETLTTLIESVPVWDLAFAPRADVWDVITRDEE